MSNSELPPGDFDGGERNDFGSQENVKHPPEYGYSQGLAVAFAQFSAENDSFETQVPQGIAANETVAEASQEVQPADPNSNLDGLQEADVFTLRHNDVRDQLQAPLAQVVSLQGARAAVAEKKAAAEKAKRAAERKARKNRPRQSPPPSESNGVTYIDKGPTTTKIVGGKVMRGVSVNELHDREVFGKMQNKAQLHRVYEILMTTNPERMSFEEAARALYQYTLEDGAETFNEMSREQKFQTVAEILIRLWLPQPFVRLDDRRVGEVIRLIVDKTPLARIVGVLQTYHQIPANSKK